MIGPVLTKLPQTKTKCSKRPPSLNYFKHPLEQGEGLNTCVPLVPSPNHQAEATHWREQPNNTAVLLCVVLFVCCFVVCYCVLIICVLCC